MVVHGKQGGQRRRLARDGAVLPLEVMSLFGECIGLTREHRFKITPRSAAGRQQGRRHPV